MSAPILLMVAKTAQEGNYIDVHVHVWTFESFLNCWRVVDALGLCRLKLDKAWEPCGSSNEFIISMVKA